MSRESDSSIIGWLQENKYISPEINEQIAIMRHSVLRTLLGKIEKTTFSWYAMLADEVTDVCNREQLNLSLRWVDEEYVVSEDPPIGLIVLPNTTADTITSVERSFLQM